MPLVRRQFPRVGTVTAMHGDYSSARRGFILNPNTTPIGPGNGTKRDSTTPWWFFFYEVNVSNITNATTGDFTLLQTVETMGTIWIDVGRGHTSPFPPDHPGVRDDSPPDPNVDREPFFNQINWFDSPGLPSADDFGRKVVRADITFFFTFAAIARRGGGCSAGLILHMTLDEGQTEPTWTATPFAIP